MKFFDANFFLHLFWLTPGLLLFWYWGRRLRARRLAAFIGDPGLTATLTPNVSKAKRRYRHGLFYMALFFLFIAAAGPHWGTKLVKRPGHSRDILVVLDTSKSMLADDVAPSRLMHAKWFIRQVLEQSTGDRFGLIAFAGDAFLECPLTQDRNGFLLFLNDIDVNTIPIGGTNIERALNEALTAFQAAEGGHRAVILITDGDELQGDSASVLDEFKARGIPIHIVGIGDAKMGSYIQIEGNKFVTDKDGKRVRTKLNEASLQRIAGHVGGSYVHSTVVHDGLDHVIDKVKGLIPDEHEENTISRPIERYQIPLAIAFLCLLIRIMTGERKSEPATATAGVGIFMSRQLKSAGMVAAAVTIVYLVSPNSYCQTTDNGRGQSGANATPSTGVTVDPSLVQPSPAQPPMLSEEEKQSSAAISHETRQMIQQAIDAIESRLETTEDALEKAYLHYNLGVNYQLLNRRDKAETEYDKALDAGANSNELKARVYQNLGVLKHEQARENIVRDHDTALKNLSDAQGYYREAMRADPKTADVSVNQELVVRDRQLVEEMKRVQEELENLRKDAEEKAQDAHDAQRAANQESNTDNRQQLQREAAEKTGQAEEAVRDLADAAEQMGQQEASKWLEQTADQFGDARDEQEQSIRAAQRGDEKQAGESAENAENMIREGLRQLGVEPKSEESEQQIGESQANEKSEDDQGPEESEDALAMNEDQNGAEDGDGQTGADGEELIDLDKLQAIRILNALQEQEGDLKKEMKEAIKRNMKLKDVEQDW